MFARFRFFANCEEIMQSEFGYDTSKLLPALRKNWADVQSSAYTLGGEPTDAAVLFMLAQINMLSGDARVVPFVQDVLKTIKRIQHQLSTEGSRALPEWLEEFRAENRRQLPKNGLLGGYDDFPDPIAPRRQEIDKLTQEIIHSAKID